MSKLNRMNPKGEQGFPEFDTKGGTVRSVREEVKDVGWVDGIKPNSTFSPEFFGEPLIEAWRCFKAKLRNRYEHQYFVDTECSLDNAKQFISKPPKYVGELSDTLDIDPRYLCFIDKGNLHINVYLLPQ